MTGGLDLVADNGHFLSHKRIEEGTFPSIGLAKKGNKTRLKIGLHRGNRGDSEKTALFKQSGIICLCAAKIGTLALALAIGPMQHKSALDNAGITRYLNYTLRNFLTLFSIQKRKLTLQICHFSYAKNLCLHKTSDPF